MTNTMSDEVTNHMSILKRGVEAKVHHAEQAIAEVMVELDQYEFYGGVTSDIVQISGLVAGAVVALETARAYNIDEFDAELDAGGTMTIEQFDAFHFEDLRLIEKVAGLLDRYRALLERAEDYDLCCEGISHTAAALMIEKFAAQLSTKH